MKKAIPFCLIVVGLINLLPVIGFFSLPALESAYVITLVNNDLTILMRHRALLFGILGAFILYSAVKPIYQPAAMTMAGVSMVGFAFLTLLIGDFNEALGKVLLIDIVGILFLAAAAVIKYGFKSS